ncbi:MAG: hypothetical protein JW751_30950 [Polyangiaceae bacterium]|nr:hypothetical protein [Polyangiaceae bacterium]
MADRTSQGAARPGSLADPAAEWDWRGQPRQRRREWTIAAAVALGATLVGFALPRWGPRTDVVKHACVVAHQPGIRGAPSGSSLIDQYGALDPGDEPARHRFVLEQIALGYLPSTWNRWVTVRAQGQKGTRVEFDVSPHGLRIGTDADWVEVPLDGPHFAAAAELLGCRLATEWMVKQTHRQARRDGNTVHYYSAAEIAASLAWYDWDNNTPDGPKMKGAAFFRRRSSLLRRWLDQHDIAGSDLVSGYFKAVVPPIDGITRPRGLEIVGGHDDENHQIQPLSGGLHPQRFFDYSHNVRLARNEIRVNGRPLTLNEFFTNVRYAREFQFRYTVITEHAYRYPERLERWMEERRGRTEPHPRRSAISTTRPTTAVEAVSATPMGSDE